MSSLKPIASLSLDLDNQWTYLKVHGDPGWETFPSYLDVLVPRVLDFLASRNLLITFFIVGQDAALKKNQASLKLISTAGHELGNHSFSHEPWFHLYDRPRIESEIELAEEHIADISGTRPLGFRGPGFSYSEMTLDVLENRGYVYDASTLPTFIGPLARLYYLCHSSLTPNDRDDRRLLFGSVLDCFRSLSPYRWRGGKGLLEIPVTTMPLLRAPIHFSYLLYLSVFSGALALAYFRAALDLCRIFRLSPSLLLHPLDFLGADDHVGLDFFPAMQLTGMQKRKLLSELVNIFCDQFRVMPLRDHASTIVGQDCKTLIGTYPLPSSPMTNDL
jgi:hypothetical protein